MNQREIAIRAHAAVREMATHENEAIRSKFKTLCMKTPALLQQSGLAQTVTFLRARERKKMYGEWFVDHVVGVLDDAEIGNSDTLQLKALQLPLGEYMVLTQSIERILIWFRRFAQVEMVDIQEDDDGHDQ